MEAQNSEEIVARLFWEPWFCESAIQLCVEGRPVALADVFRGLEEAISETANWIQLLLWKPLLPCGLRSINGVLTIEAENRKERTVQKGRNKLISILLTFEKMRLAQSIPIL